MFAQNGCQYRCCPVTIGKDIEKTRDPMVRQRLEVPDGWKYEHGAAEGGNGWVSEAES
jgi:hypothetical protein